MIWILIYPRSRIQTCRPTLSLSVCTHTLFLKRKCSTMIITSASFWSQLTPTLRKSGLTNRWRSLSSDNVNNRVAWSKYWLHNPSEITWKPAASTKILTKICQYFSETSQYFNAFCIFSISSSQCLQHLGGCFITTRTSPEHLLKTFYFHCKWKE